MAKGVCHHARMGGKQDEIACWNEETGRRWAEHADALDRRLAPITEALLDRANIEPGARVLDVGCGAGSLSLAIAERCRPTSLVGIDVSAPLLEVARRRSGDALTLIEADAESHRFEPPPFDRALSRFGVMFFDDTAAGFANLARALRTGGRLTVACWAAPRANDWFTLPREVAGRHVELEGSPVDDTPGPFRLADEQRLVAALRAAGLAEIELAVDEGRMPIGEDLDEAVAYCMQIGPAAAAARRRPEVREAIAADLRSALGERLRADGVTLGYRCWIVSARAS